MSQQAEIVITGKSRKRILTELSDIKAWDNGHNYPIRVTIGVNQFIDDSIDNVIKATDNLEEYIMSNFNLKRQVIKSGGDDDLYVIEDPDYSNNEGLFSKKRKVLNKLPKKRRKKNKKTHRKK